MKSYVLSRLLLLLFFVHWDQVNCLCRLDEHTTAAECDDLDDARYINTYHLHGLRTHTTSKTLTPGHFLNLTSLRHLDLSRGKIKNIETGSFAKLSNLQSLNLAENHIEHLEAGAFDGLKHVHSLRLGDNAIRQLPSALMSLKELRMLDLSGNPLNCNCASMKLRDVLLARGVKISKKTLCSEPVSAKSASIYKPDTKTTCVFEKQDLEMQGDQPIDDSAEGSGALDAEYDEKEVDQTLESSSKENEEEAETETAAPPAPETSPLSITPSITSAEVSSTEEMTSSTTAAPKDDITFEDTDDSSKKESTTEENTESSVEVVTDSKEPEEAQPQTTDDDLIVAVTESKKTDTTEATEVADKKPGITDDLIVPDEGSGEGDDDGSGVEGSGLLANMPSINFNETAAVIEDENTQLSSTSTTMTTTEGSSWWGFGDIISNLNPWGTSETTQAPSTTEKSPQEDLKEEQFIAVTQKPATNDNSINGVDEVTVSRKTVSNDISSKQSPRTYDSPNEIGRSANGEIEDNSVDPAFSQESKKGMGSYVVLATLLAILAALIAFAAYKGDFCRKKRKRRDVERGTEMKDMQRSLLDQNTTQPKVQVSNGTTLENVPLMNSTAPPEEPKDNQRSYDITPAVVTNGNGPSSLEVNDPVKPPRKSAAQEIEAPLNGLNPPMDDIDGPVTTSLHNGSMDAISNEDYCERPPLTPGAQRVKITMQDNPDSVPKTPILITRVKGGENLVKSP